MRKIFSNPVNLLKAHFVAGILVLIPFAVIAWILGAILAMIWRLQLLLPESWLPASGDEPAATLVKVAFTVGAAILLALVISILGWASTNYFGQKAIVLVGEAIGRIPVLRSVYSALDQLLKTIAAGGGRQFSRVVYVEYPRKGMWTLAFVTGSTRSPAFPVPHLNLYIPTTPNPTSGFYLLVPEADVRESLLRVEEAFKIILSLGIAQSSSTEEAR